MLKQLSAMMKEGQRKKARNTLKASDLGKLNRIQLQKTRINQKRTGRGQKPNFFLLTR